jgi:FeS assembly SUF system regulator
MLRLSNLADYAVVVMTAAARDAMHAPAASQRPLSAAQLAQQSGVPLPTVAKLLGQLSRAGLLISHRGVAGGYQLARAPADICLAEIIEAIDGPVALTHCASSAADCDLLACCPVRPHWEPVNRAVREALGAVSLAALAPARAPVPA